jgi:hypothetical protein
VVIVIFNHIVGVMVSILTSSTVDRSFKPIKPKTIKLVFAASLLNKTEETDEVLSGKCVLSGATCLFSDCTSKPHHHLIEK